MLYFNIFKMKKLLRWIIAYWSGKYWFQNYRNQNLVLRWTLCIRPFKQDIFTGSTSAMVWWAFSPSYHCFWLVECFVDAVVRRMSNQPSVEGARVVEDACSFCGWIKSQTQIKLSIVCTNFSVNRIVDTENMYIMHTLIPSVIKIHRRKIERRVMLIHRNRTQF